MALSKSVIFSLGEDFEKSAGKLDSENCAESWIKSWVDNYKHEIGWKNSVCVAHDYSDLRKIKMIPPSRIVCFGVWIIVRSSKCCIRVIW